MVDAGQGCRAIFKLTIRLKGLRDAMVRVGLSAGCLRYLWALDVLAGSCADPCPKFGLINSSILNTPPHSTDTAPGHTYKHSDYT
jgi:hypothetical protein